MFQILTSNFGERYVRGPFSIRRIRPGAVFGEGADPTFGPLSVIDHAMLEVGTVVRMHEHKNDEILSYLWRGSMVHEDRAGYRVSVSANRLMMMNAGEGFWHEERTPHEPVEMLQIFVRPRDADLEAMVSFYERPGGVPTGAWGLIAGPDRSDAPLAIRNTVLVYDLHLPRGQEAQAPTIEGLASWLYVMNGTIEVAGRRIGKGEALCDPDEPLPTIRAKDAATLVLFMVDRSAQATAAGTISGR